MSYQYLQIDSIHLFAWLLLMYFLSRVTIMEHDEIVQNKRAERYTTFYAFLIFIPVIVMAVFGRPRADTYAYLNSFRMIPTSLRMGWKMVLQSDRPGFMLIGVLIKNIFGGNVTIYRMVIALIHSIPIIIVFRKYSTDYLFSVFLFIASGMHLAWMMNGLRQFMAVSIVFAATPWMLEKKYIRTILVIIIAATIHNTALFMIPVIFIVHGEAWNRRIIIFSSVVIIASFLFGGNIELFNKIISVFGYSTNLAISLGDDGANPIRVFVSAIPTILALLSYRELREENNSLVNICINMSVVTVCLYVLAVFTSGIMTGRMPIYTNLYSLILLPHVIDVYFIGNNVKVIRIVTILLYLVYFLVQH